MTEHNGRTPAALDTASFSDVVSEVADLDAFRESAWTSLEVASNYWRAPMKSPHLTPRVKELVLLGMHASATSLNVEAVERHIKRAQVAGATAGEIIDVLLTIVALANHALYFSVPILQEELRNRGQDTGTADELDPAFEEAKQAFIRSRGFWNADREAIARLMPDYYQALDAVGTESWNNGPLSTKEREFICIGIDCTVTHNYEPGLRRHIRNALDEGATPGEILEIFQLAGLLGLEGYLLGAKILFGQERPVRSVETQPEAGPDNFLNFER